MARRRYISTELGTDPTVTRLVNEYGVFAALLYTWMIPHADDDGLIVSEPEEIQLRVVPGFRSYGVESVENALSGMLALGLIEYANDKQLRIDIDRWGDRRRDGRGHRAWRTAVLRRDGYRCQRCGRGSKDDRLHAHHILVWSAYPDERLNPENGVTLCADCHLKAHSSDETRL